MVRINATNQVQIASEDDSRVGESSNRKPSATNTAAQIRINSKC